MNNQWFKVSVKYVKTFTDGTLKKVTEVYLVNAYTFTEVESRIYQEVGEFIKGVFTVSAISRVDYQDLFMYDDSEEWFEASVNYVSEDSDSGREVKITNKFLVTAHNVKEAYERVDENLKGLMVDYETPTITKTKYVEAFMYTPLEDNTIEEE